MHEKAWGAWLNSTPGILGLLARRTKNLTYSVFPLANLRALPCPNPEAVNIPPLIDAFDRRRGNELEELPKTRPYTGTARGITRRKTCEVGPRRSNSRRSGVRYRPRTPASPTNPPPPRRNIRRARAASDNGGFDGSMREAALASNGHHSIANRLPEPTNRRVRERARQCVNGIARRSGRQGQPRHVPQPRARRSTNEGKREHRMLEANLYPKPSKEELWPSTTRGPTPDVPNPSPNPCAVAQARSGRERR